VRKVPRTSILDKEEVDVLSNGSQYLEGAVYTTIVALKKGREIFIGKKSSYFVFTS